MQPEPTELSQNASVGPESQYHHPTAQHGLFGDPSEPSTPALLPYGEQGSIGGSSTEWSLSPTSEIASPGLSDPSGLSPDQRPRPQPSTELDLESLRLSLRRSVTDTTNHVLSSVTRVRSSSSTLHEFPQELLFQVLSHLPAQDLLTMKLVSRRFYTLVTSPTAWSSAFSKYFPGPESLKGSAFVTGYDTTRVGLHTGTRVFTRLTPSVSWSSEYLGRTRLIRCLMRGRPSLPFAAPCPGKPGKGSATFTFSSRIWRGCTALDADFGSVFDKRKPQFMHGSALSGAVTGSDRRGKFDAWGFSNPVFFRHFHEIHPGYEPYGLGTGTCVGCPNVMEVSQSFGMVYAECTPGGNVHFLPVGEKQTRILTSFTGASSHCEGIPCVLSEAQCPCAIWIAKSTAIPRISQGMIGILAGSSNGVLTAYSLGSQGGLRFERGEMTARWVLSPGVPIVAIHADNHFTEDRLNAGRVWVFVVNALGEVFYLKGLPTPAKSGASSRNFVSEELAVKEELSAWRTGFCLEWQHVPSTARVTRYTDATNDSSEWYGVVNVGRNDQTDSQERARIQEEWLHSAPIEIRSHFNDWDMKRKLLADFAADDGNGAGEAAVVIHEDQEEGHNNIMRFRRSISTSNDHTEDTNKSISLPITSTSALSEMSKTSWSFSSIPRDANLEPTRDGQLEKDVWYCTQYLPGSHRSVHVTATALDTSVLAVTTLGEDEMLQAARTATRHHGASKHGATVEHEFSRAIPGKRARLFSIGTSTGIILVWDMRTSTSVEPGIMNEVPPVRVIVTESPGIASLALSSLYLVHGGTEGLLQAWDPLASTTEPIRTLSSRRLVNNRRRAILAAQQAAVPPTWANQNPDHLAASAILLDPDPTVLRGVATIDSWIKYWSYSSASAAEDLSRSQKRKLKRGQGSKNPNLDGSNDAEMSWSANQRRNNLKGFVNQELHMRKMDEADRRREMKEDRRFAGRFGTELLGADASEEDMLAYAKLLSQEEDEKRARTSAEANIKLSRDASVDDIEAHKAALSERDAENWKFASWKQRFEMLPEGGVALPKLLSDSRVATPTADDTETRRAIELSLGEHDRESRTSASISGASSPPAVASSSKQPLDAKQLENDPDLAEAIALSLTHQQLDSSSSPDLPDSSGHATSPSPAGADYEEDELSRAIRLSLADQGSSSPVTDIEPSKAANEADFPALPSSSPPTSSSSYGKTKEGKGKGRKSVW